MECANIGGGEGTEGASGDQDSEVRLVGLPRPFSACLGIFCWLVLRLFFPPVLEATRRMGGRSRVATNIARVMDGRKEARRSVFCVGCESGACGGRYIHRVVTP